MEWANPPTSRPGGPLVCGGAVVAVAVAVIAWPSGGMVELLSAAGVCSTTLGSPTLSEPGPWVVWFVTTWLGSAPGVVKTRALSLLRGYKPDETRSTEQSNFKTHKPLGWMRTCSLLHFFGLTFLRGPRPSTVEAQHSRAEKGYSALTRGWERTALIVRAELSLLSSC